MPGRQAGSSELAASHKSTFTEAATQHVQCQAGRLAQRTRRFLDTLHPKQPQAASKHMHTTAQRLLPLTTLIPCWFVHGGLSVVCLLGFAALLLTSLAVDSVCLNQPNLLQLQLAMSDRSLMLPLPKAQPSGVSLRWVGESPVLIYGGRGPIYPEGTDV